LGRGRPRTQRPSFPSTLRTACMPTVAPCSAFAVTAAQPAELRRPVPVRTWAGPPAPTRGAGRPQLLVRTARSPRPAHSGRLPTTKRDSDIRSRLVQTGHGSTHTVNGQPRQRATAGNTTVNRGQPRLSSLR
jgi:hypothetical protein